MMKLYKNILVAILLIGISHSYAQTEGQITDEMIQTFRKELDMGKIKALQNAVTHNSVNQLAINHKNSTDYDFFFKYKVKTNGISNQKSSGRCWLYTGLNTLKPYVLSKNNLTTFEFSHTYNFFWDQLEKSNLFLEGIISTLDKALDDRTVEWFFKNPIGDGGQWTTFADIVKKYGVVPKSIMPETNSSENTRNMSTFIRKKLKEDGLELRAMHQKGSKTNEIRDAKNKMLADIYKLLVINLGEPPTEFEWRYEDKDGNISELKKYTPKSFFEEAVGINLSDYIMIMNDPTREYYKLYEVQYDRNIVEGYNWKYINLPADDIKAFALLSIKNNEALYFSCDVGKFLDKDAGTLDINNYNYNALFDMEFDMNKKERIQSFESGSSHGMALIGVDVDEKEKPTKWLLENSWGATSGFKGHLLMTDEWFDEYMFRLVVNKEYVSDKVLKIMKEKPVLLPPWDPMFAPEE